MWTLNSLRKALGEHGFFELKETTTEVVPDVPGERQTWRTAWVRDSKLVYLINVTGAEPYIEDSSGHKLDLNSTGYRDPKAPEAWRVTDG
jgi:hypothetical protein